MCIDRVFFDTFSFRVQFEGPSPISETIMTDKSTKIVTFSATVAGAYVIRISVNGVLIRDGELFKLFVAGLFVADFCLLTSQLLCFFLGAPWSTLSSASIF
jgi:hypothetical protein